MRRALVATVEPAHIFALARIALRQSREFPNQLERHRIDFQNPRAIAECLPRTLRRREVRIAIFAGNAIVNDQYIARPRQACWNDMAMMRTDDGTERLHCGGYAVFGSNLPNDLTGLLGDYVKHRAAVIGNDVLGVEPFVPLMEPLVRPNVRASVLENAMGGATSAYYRVPRRLERPN